MWIVYVDFPTIAIILPGTQPTDMLTRFIPLMIGLRYTRAKRRNHFISFVSGFSLFGMAIGVFALIVVLSVMNGFDRELKQCILSVVPHGTVTFANGQSWQAMATEVSAVPGVSGVAPYVAGYGMVSFSGGYEGVEVQGILPEQEGQVSVIDQHMVLGRLSDLKPGEFDIILGSLLARYLGVSPGDKVSLVLPQLNITPAGVFPRQKRFRVAGVFEVGAQVDQSLVLIHLADAQKLFRLGDGVTGLRVHTPDLYQAQPVLARVAKELASDGAQVKDWSQTQGGLFQAVQMEKTVVTILLMIIVAVAAFNIVTSLVLMVADKRSDIAVLRTLGLSQQQVMGIFIVQGCAVGWFGILLGAVLGSLAAIFIGPVVSAIEQLTGLYVFDPSVYFVSSLPSEWQLEDLLVVCGSGVVLSLLATLYPAYRAAQVEPAEVLRYE